jgi:hypothetical protein
VPWREVREAVRDDGAPEDQNIGPQGRFAQNRS